MDQALATCLAFPPEQQVLQDDAAYDQAIQAHLLKLTKLLKDPPVPLGQYGGQLLELIDPDLNSLSYVAVLHSLLLPNLVGPREFILDKLVRFLLGFDPRQLRYAGSHLLEIMTAVCSGSLLPPSVAVEVVSAAILKIDPTGSMFISTHLQLVKLAYSTNNIEPALKVVEKNIVFYPGMANWKRPTMLCDMTLSPSVYIHKETGLTNHVKAASVLDENGEKAHAAFERVVTFSTREGGCSKIMAEAYKKWVLVSLLFQGQGHTLPQYAGPAAAKAYQTLGKPYKDVASLFDTTNAEELRSEVQKSSQIWQDDQNVGLMKEIKNLQKVFSKISIAEIRQQTKSAQTGTNLNSDDDIEALIQNMIISNSLKGVMEKNDDGTVFLTFLPSSTVLSEAEYAQELAKTAVQLKALEPIFKATNERLGTSREYIKHLVKEQKRAADKSELDPTMGFESHVDDEDLMGGVTSTA
ncbi:hypothetical protein PG994_012362 [Apiospora phragmitis]|uniref:COP9 signalosome complex subunit 3 N-terminal helical repeats domain-containing protein n=1 Tax=Apiospora phragmitis TaxID=2905665 RepID=A0ABR1TVU5_9PEZI